MFGAVLVSLFSNDEVLAVNQDALGKQGTLLRRDETVKTEVWTKPLEDGTVAVALYNRGETPAEVAVSTSELGLAGAQPMRDLWRQKDQDKPAEKLSVKVAPHGAELFKVGTPK